MHVLKCTCQLTHPPKRRALGAFARLTDEVVKLASLGKLHRHKLQREGVSERPSNECALKRKEDTHVGFGIVADFNQLNNRLVGTRLLQRIQEARLTKSQTLTRITSVPDWSFTLALHLVQLAYLAQKVLGV